MTIIKLLGPSGAGKTTVVREIMKAAGRTDALLVDKKIVGYTIHTRIGDRSQRIYVPGSYESNCGGVDTVGSAKEVMDLIDVMVPNNHVIYEGLLQGTYYGAMGQWSKKFGDDFIYAWLNTPLDVCMERLHERRAKNNTVRPLNVQQAMDKWGTVAYNFEKAINKGHRGAIIEWDQPTVPQIKELLK